MSADIVDAPAPTSRLEVRSIDYVPLDERHGKLWHLGPLWFMSNAQIAALSAGTEPAWSRPAVMMSREFAGRPRFRRNASGSGGVGAGPTAGGMRSVASSRTLIFPCARMPGDVSARCTTSSISSSAMARRATSNPPANTLALSFTAKPSTM